MSTRQEIAILTMALLMVSATSVQADIVGHWMFDEGEGAVAYDSSSYDNYGIIYGASWTTGILDSALSFDGSDQVDAGYAASSRFVDGDSFTLAAWIKIVADGKRKPVICRYRFGLEAHDDKISIWIRGTDNFYWCGTTSLNAGEWYHVVGVYEDFGTSQNEKIYVNGELENTQWTTPLSNWYGLSNLYIGRSWHVGGLNFNGLIDDVRIYNHALTAAEVSTLATLTVEIDIKPGNYPNSINPNTGGVIPVAILTTADFNASTVDPQTVAIEDAGARGKGKSDRYGSMEDVDDDGDLDLVVQIENVIEWDLAATEATLTGETYNGIPIQGTDTVNIVPPE